VIGILDIARTRHRGKAGDHRFGTFDERVVDRDQPEKSSVATGRNNNAAGERRIIKARGSSSGIAQIDSQIRVGRAAAAHDEARISAEGIGRTEFHSLRILRRRCLEAHDWEHRRIDCDIHWRRRDRLAE
jgi:hypothetical protein